VKSLRVSLPDGAAAAIRPIEASDREALRAGFERLSPESRYRRFFTPMTNLSDRDLDYLTKIDHRDHEALIAVDETGRNIVGVARYVRTGPEEAEPAIVVADDWQGRGLGQRLLTELADRAREEGVQRFRAPVLAENDAALRLLGSLGEHWERQEGNEVEVQIELTPAPGERRTLRTLLRGAAVGTVKPAVAVLDRLGVRARYGVPDRALQANTIVVGIDPREPGGAAVRVAGELAPALGASVHLVGARRPLIDDEIEASVAIERAADGLRERGVEVDTHLRSTDAVTALVQTAAEHQARLVLVGATRPGSPRLVPGDIPAAVARQAPCDVLIARSKIRPNVQTPETGSS
jgi:nucleotide-binding universal stress UspA family protein/GNAT superfamily N-acetyltransferase